MEKRIFLLLMMAVGFGLMSCSDSEAKGTETTLLAVSANQVEVSGKNGSTTVTVIAETAPTVECDADWLSTTITADTEQAQRYVLSITASDNPTAESRWGIVKVKVKQEVRQIKVMQLATMQEDPEDGSMTAQKIASQMGLGINIGNTLEAIGGETAWGAAPVNRDYVRGIKEAGFSTVRIPCSWNIYMGDDNVIDAAWLDRVHEVVGYCIDEGLYVLLNDHWDNGWIEKSLHDGYNEVTAKRLKDMWTQIAKKMENYDYHLLFAGFNEPDLNDKEDNLYYILTEYGQDFFDTVRATGGNNAERVLVMQAPSTSFDILTAGKFSLPEDGVPNRMMVECHFYSPYNFTLMTEDADWGKTAWFWGEGNHVEGSEHNSTWGEEDYVRDTLHPVYTKVVSQGIPVIMGEYSCMYRGNLSGNELEMHKQSRASWAECVTREAINNGIIPIWWDTPGGIINRKTGAVDEQYILDGILAGSAAAVSPY